MIDIPRPELNSKFENADAAILDLLVEYFVWRGLTQIDNPHDHEWNVWNAAISEMATMIAALQDGAKVMELIAALIANTRDIAATAANDELENLDLAPRILFIVPEAPPHNAN